MQIILLDETRFDNFAISHPSANFYQTSNYGRFMSKHGYNAYYLGLADDIGNIKAATLMIVKNDKNNSKRKMGYAPRGFLIDWNDDELVKNFTNGLKDFLSKRSFTYLKLDPAVVYKEHNIDGSENMVGETNIDFVSKLQALEYIHLGYNNGNETSRPRWNTLTKLNNNIISLYNSISKEARDKIKLSNTLGCKVYKGSSNDISLLYSIINKSTPPIDYYMDYYQFFSINNGYDVFFTKLEPATYVNSSKNMFEKEEQRNNELNNAIQDFSNPNREALINQKMESDELLATYKNNMLDAIQLFQSYPSGIVIGATAVIKYGKTVYFITGGINKKFEKHYPEYLLYWQLMQEYARSGYTKADFNGITSDFVTNNEIKYKTELCNKIVEYVGEFDLVINKKAYYTGSKLNPIINWLNTPV